MYIQTRKHILKLQSKLEFSFLSFTLFVAQYIRVKYEYLFIIITYIRRIVISPTCFDEVHFSHLQELLIFISKY